MPKAQQFLDKMMKEGCGKEKQMNEVSGEVWDRIERDKERLFGGDSNAMLEAFLKAMSDADIEENLEYIEDMHGLNENASWTNSVRTRKHAVRDTYGYELDPTDVDMVPDSISGLEKTSFPNNTSFLRVASVGRNWDGDKRLSKRGGVVVLKKGKYYLVPASDIAK